MKRILFSILVLLLLPVASSADATPSLPSIDSFTGTVTLQGVQAPAGTLVAIYVSNSYVGNVSVKADGTYKAYVGVGSLGNPIAFLIDGTVVGTSTRKGASQTLDLFLTPYKTINVSLNSTNNTIDFRNEYIDIFINTNNNVSGEPLSVELYSAGTFSINNSKYIKGIVINFNNSLVNNATITIHYVDADMSGMDEASIKLYYYNSTSSNWELMQGILNTNANTFTANIPHFSTYALFGTPAAPPVIINNNNNNGGGGGGGALIDEVKTNTTKNITVCTPNWSCTSWGKCNADTFSQTRTCTDLNACNEEKLETQQCTPQIVRDAETAITKAVNVTSSAAKTFLNDARAAYVNGNYALAEELAQRALDVDSVKADSMPTALALSQTSDTAVAAVIVILIIAIIYYAKKKKR